MTVLHRGDLVELEIARLVAGGAGIGFREGKAVFVPAVLPGERVRVRITQPHRDFDRGVAVERTVSSPHRVAPPCPFAGRCGGCDWQHIDYPEQLRQKAAIAAEALRRTGGIAREAPDIEPSRPWRSRNRAQVHRGPEGLGYMASGSTRVVAVDACPVAAPEVERMFRGEAPAPEGLDRFTVFGAQGAVAVEGRDDGRELRVEVNGRSISFSVGCFFQSNLSVLDALVRWALEGLRGGSAADLYCGVGLFGSFLAERFSHIICVESSAMSLAYARRNVVGSDHEFYPLSVEQWIASGTAPGGLDAVVLDPPRTGLAPEVRQWLRSRPPVRLVYVSCNPVTLARDLGDLHAGGFSLEDLRLFDLYPQTSHIEAVAKLRGPANPRGSTTDP